MTNEISEIISATLASVIGNKGSKAKKESASVLESVVAEPVAPNEVPFTPAFSADAAVIDGVFEEVATEATVEENKSENKKVEPNMTNENVVVEEAVAVEAPVADAVTEAEVADAKKFFAGMFASMKERARNAGSSAKAALEGAKAKVASDSKEATKEGFLSKVKAFGKGFVEGFTGFVKAHATKAFLGLGVLALAGTVTSGMTMAVLLGGALYAAGSFATSYIVSKYKKEEFDSVASGITAVGNSATYGFFGAIAAYFVAQIAVAATAYAFVYGYTAIAYVGYFIVA